MCHYLLPQLVPTAEMIRRSGLRQWSGRVGGWVVLVMLSAVCPHLPTNWSHLSEDPEIRVEAVGMVEWVVEWVIRRSGMMSAMLG